MRIYALFPLIALLLLATMPVHAAVLTQGAYDFEACVPPDCNFSGTWVQQVNGAQTFQVATTTGAYVEFQVSGRHLLIYRAVSSGWTPMVVSVNGTPTTVSNSNVVTLYNVAHLVNLPAGTVTIRITNPNVYLDQFVVLDAPGSVLFPTPVPTATILPSSTPASTTTPQPTPTPQPTATPISLVWAISPNTRFDTANGQMVGFDFTITVGDLVLGIFLFGLLLMFIFKMFLDETRKRR